MSGALYGIIVIAMLLVIRWAMQNELEGGDGQKGIFAMTSRPKKDSQPEQEGSRFRRRRSQR